MSRSKPHKRPPRTETPHRRDQELLDVATRVFYERGYADATVQEVAEELGILKGSLYHYIDSKEDLLVRLVEQIHTDAEVMLADVIAADLAAPADRLELYVRRVIEYNLENIRRIAVYHREVDRLGPDRHAQVMVRRAAHEQFVERLLEEAQIGRPADARPNAQILSNLVFGAIVWVYTWYRPGATVETDAIVRTCCRFVISGLSGRSQLAAAGSSAADSHLPLTAR
jgi:AcrR family transcriptional regulator